jgi:multidrug efflux pump subunit AcrA (membrane-fusion protein)
VGASHYDHRRRRRRGILWPATVLRKDVPIVIEAPGTVTPIETIAVQSRVNGQIVKASFRQGQPVKEGDPLFLIDPRPYQTALDQAQAQLAHDRPFSRKRRPISRDIRSSTRKVLLPRKGRPTERSQSSRTKARRNSTKPMPKPRSSI